MFQETNLKLLVKKLFKLLITRDILNPEIGNNLQKLVDKSKITEVIEYLENLPEDLSMIYSVEFKDLDEIVKIYLHETDQTLARDVLQYLIYLKFESKELFDIPEDINKFKSSSISKEIKNEYIKLLNL